MKKIFLSILVLIVAVVALLVVFQDMVLKVGVEQAVTRVTGFPTTVNSIHYSFPETIHIKGLTIRNPEGFQEKIFADIPEIFVSISLQEILKKESMHLREIRLNLQEVMIERNAEGVTNLQKLSSVGQQASGGQSKPAPKAETKAEKMPFLLDRFVLTIRKVGFKNHGGVIPGVDVKANALSGTSVDMNVQEQVFTDIKDPLILVNLVVMKIVYGTTFGRLAGLDPKKLLGQGLDTTFASGEQLFKQGAGLATKQLGTLGNKAGSLVTETAGLKTDQLSGAVSSGLDQGTTAVSGLFGKLKKAVGENQEAPAEKA